MTSPWFTMYLRTLRPEPSTRKARRIEALLAALATAVVFYALLRG